MTYYYSPLNLMSEGGKNVANFPLGRAEAIGSNIILADGRFFTTIGLPVGRQAHRSSFLGSMILAFDL